jgi:non-ribosomal peptide synthetase component F/acyl carrier protein
LLSRYTGQEDIAVGVPVAGRTQLETESLIGYFVNLLVLRVALPGNIKFQDALHHVGDAALDAYVHQEVPFQRLVKELRPEGAANFSPLFQVMFELRNLPKVPIQQHGGLRMEKVPFTPDFIGALDLVLEVLETPDGLNFTCRYASALFRPGTIQRMTDLFVAVLQCLADNPDQRLSDLPLNIEAAGNQLKLNWNVMKTEDLKDARLPQLSEVPFERMAETRTNVSKEQHVPIVSAKTDLEGKIVQIWRDVLALDKVGLNDNFFEVGGHSLLMIEIRNKIGELLGKKISVLDLFRCPTIGSLSDYLTKEYHE